MLEKEREKLQKEQARRRRRERKRNERAGSQSESDGKRHAEGHSSRGGNDRQEAPHPADGAGSVPADAEAVAPSQEERVEDQPMPEEKILLRLMLEHGTTMVEFILGNMALDEFTAGAPRKTIQAFIQMYQEDRVRPQQILEGRFGDKLQRLGASVMVDEHQLSENWARNSNISVPRLNNDPFEAAASAMTLLKLDRVNETIQEHKRRMRRADQEGNDDKMRALQQKMMSLYELRKHIENREYLDRDPRHEPR
jgi:DNA primase